MVALQAAKRLVSVAALRESNMFDFKMLDSEHRARLSEEEGHKKGTGGSRAEGCAPWLLLARSRLASRGSEVETRQCSALQRAEAQASSG